jgi:uncharacterized SAM-binding protein YcdF (DUF218 family)
VSIAVPTADAIGPPSETKRPASRWKHRLARGSVVVILLLLAAWLSAPWTLPAAARFLDCSDPPQHTDYILLLGGDVGLRPFAAARLLRDGWAERILITQPVLTSERFEGQPSERGLTERILLHEGVPLDRVITLPHDVLTTADEAEALAQFLDSHPGATVTVLTSRYHTRRAKLIFGRALGERASQLSFLGTPSDYFDESNWWRTEEGTRAYVMEYAKLAYNLVRQK